MTEVAITRNGRGDLLIPITPEMIARLGYPHSLRWTLREDGAIIATPSQSRWSQRQIKKFNARHGLTGSSV